MATPTSRDANVLRELRAKLEALEGVKRAVVEEEGVWLICEPSAEREPVELAARRVLASDGLDLVSVPVQVAVSAGSGERRRLRFERLERLPEEGGTVRVRVVLEWRDREYTGEVVGESGLVLEQRSAGLAALAAIDALLGGEVPLRLVGIKQIRAFDTDLVVASVYHPGSDPGHFVGAVRAGTDPVRGAAVAVLHALNRMLGNYLVTID